MAAMREVSGSYTGTHLAEVVLEVIKDWGIQNNLGYFMIDNADNNDTMMRDIAISKFILLWLIKEFDLIFI